MKGLTRIHYIFLLLVFLCSLAGRVSAGEYTITFSSQTSGPDSQTYYAKKTMVASGIASADEAFGTITCAQTSLCYSGKRGYGMKIGTAMAHGTLTLEFSTPVARVSAIIIDCASYNSPNNAATITVASAETTIGTHTTSATHANFEEARWESLNIDALGSISLESDKYCYIRTITIVTYPVFTLNAVSGSDSFTTDLPMSYDDDAGTYTATVHMQMKNAYKCKFLYDGQTYGVAGQTIDGPAIGESLELQTDDAIQTSIIPWFNGTYTVSFDGESKSFSVECTEPTGYDLNITSAGWATLSLPFAIRMDDALAAFSVNERKIGDSGTSVSLIPIYAVDGNIAENTPMAIRGEAGVYTLAKAETGTSVEGNLLRNHQSDGDVEAVSGAKLYKMALVNGRVGWYFGKADGAPFSLGRYKAYLALTEEQQNAARSLSFSDMLDEGATGITQIMYDGKSKDPATIYNLAGRQVNGNYRGILIVNGKKTLQ